MTKYADAVLAGSAPSPITPSHKALSKRIEEAMAQAIRDALAEGISINDERIKERMMEARERVASSGN